MPGEPVGERGVKLIIRDAQLKALGEARADLFYRELAAGLKAGGKPVFTRLSNEECFARFMEHVKRAETYGITGRGPLRSYARLIGQYGFDFDMEDPEASAVLKSEDMGGAEKLHLVYEWFTSKGK